MLAEGKYKLIITKIINETDLECKVMHGGNLKKRGINLPETNLDIPALSQEDREVLAYILANDGGS